MKMKTICTHANLHNGREIADPIAILYANEALSMLATLYDSACKRDTSTLGDLAEDTWVDLPEGCINVTRVKVEGYESLTWQASQGQIKFPQSAASNVTMEYLRKSNDISTIEEVPEISELYHTVLSLFIASRERSRLFGDQESESQRLMGEFHAEAAAADLRIKNQKNGPKYIGKRNFV